MRLPFGSRGGAAMEHYFPLDGDTSSRSALQVNNYNYIQGLGDRRTSRCGSIAR